MALRALISYLAGMVPAQVALAHEVLGGALIVKTLALLPTELYAIEAGFVLDVHPKKILVWSEVTLTVTRATLIACPALAQPEVTIAVKSLARSQRRASEAYLRDYCPPVIMHSSRYHPTSSILLIEDVLSSEELPISVPAGMSLVTSTPTARPMCPFASIRKLQKQYLEAVREARIYFSSFIPAQVPLALEMFAVAEILKTLVPLSATISAIEASPNSLNITLSKVALNVTRATLQACPAVATYEVIEVTAQLARAYRQAKITYLATTSPSSPTIMDNSSTVSSAAPLLLLEEAAPVLQHTESVESDIAIQTPAAAPASALALAAEEGMAIEDDCLPPGFDTPNESNDRLYHAVLGVGNGAVKEGSIAATLAFSGLAIARYLRAHGSLESVVAYSEEHPLFLTPAKLQEVRSNLRYMTNILASIDAGISAVPEEGAELLVEGVAFLDNAACGLIPIDATSTAILLQCGREIGRLVGTAVTQYPGDKLGACRRAIQCVAGGCLAIGSLHRILSQHRDLVFWEVGHMFRRLFDAVMDALSILESTSKEDEGAAKRRLGQGMCCLSPEAGVSVSASLDFVEESAEKGIRVDTLDSWIIRNNTRYQRCNRNPFISTASLPLPLSRSSSGTTSGNATPQSQSGSVIPGANTFKSATSGQPNGNRGGKRSNGRGRGRGQSNRNYKS